MRTTIRSIGLQDLLKEGIELTDKHTYIDTLEAKDAVVIIACMRISDIIGHLKPTEKELFLSPLFSVLFEEDDEVYYYTIIPPQGKEKEFTMNKIRITTAEGDIQWGTENSGIYAKPIMRLQ